MSARRRMRRHSGKRSRRQPIGGGRTSGKQADCGSCEPIELDRTELQEILEHAKAALSQAEFLKQPGAPLDNNVCERALKKAILHRKSSYFHKTQNGARVGDLFMSLIHTCELNGVNPLDCRTELQKHATELSAQPDRWMPWNYRQMLQETDVTRSQTCHTS